MIQPTDINGVVVDDTSRILVFTSETPPSLIHVHDIVEQFPGLWRVTGLNPSNGRMYTYKITSLGVMDVEASEILVLNNFDPLSPSPFRVSKLEPVGWVVRNDRNPDAIRPCATFEEGKAILDRLTRIWSFATEFAANESTSEFQVPLEGVVEIVAPNDFEPQNDRQHQLQEMWKANVKLPPGLNMLGDNVVKMAYDVWTQNGKQPEMDLYQWWMENYENFGQQGLYG